MKLEEAIEILTKPKHRRANYSFQEYDEAVQLGSEALKRLVELRHTAPLMIHKPLPSEPE